MNVDQTQGQLTYVQTQKFVNYVCLFICTSQHTAV